MSDEGMSEFPALIMTPPKRWEGSYRLPTPPSPQFSELFMAAKKRPALDGGWPKRGRRENNYCINTGHIHTHTPPTPHTPTYQRERERERERERYISTRGP